MGKRTRTSVIASALGLGLLAAATTAVAGGADADGTHLRSTFPSGGDASLELEDRNTEAAVCFIWDNDLPQDGDSFESRILTRAGVEVLDLGTADQWVDGAGEGCEVPPDDGYRAVFADPGSYVVEVRVVENQGTRATPPFRSGPLERASG